MKKQNTNTEVIRWSLRPNGSLWWHSTWARTEDKDEDRMPDWNIQKKSQRKYELEKQNKTKDPERPRTLDSLRPEAGPRRKNIFISTSWFSCVFCGQLYYLCSMKNSENLFLDFLQLIKPGKNKRRSSLEKHTFNPCLKNFHKSLAKESSW